MPNPRRRLGRRGFFRTLFFISILGSGAGICAQQVPESAPTPEKAQEEALRRLVSYFESNLNTLGHPDIPSTQKDILITESYKKLFRDASVQIEDDLDPKRSTVTYKDAPAYLLDVDFFFREAVFTYHILEIIPQEAENGEASWLLPCRSTLQGKDLYGDTVSRELERFIEINRTSEGLKIVSIYTTKLDRREANRLWWAGLSPVWKQRLSAGAQLSEGLRLADVRRYDQHVLLSASDTFLLSGYRNSLERPDSNHILFYGDTLSVTGKPELLLRAEAIDAFLEGLLATKDLDLSGQTIVRLQPVSVLKGLRRLNLSGTGVTDISALRSLTQLEELDVSECALGDFSPLRLAKSLQTLKARHSVLPLEWPEWSSLTYLDISNSVLAPGWSPVSLHNLRHLNLSGTTIGDLSTLGNLNALEYLDISETPVNRLDPLEKTPALRVLLASRTPLRSLRPLQGLENLERVYLDGTAVSNLEPLSGKINLERIYCDGTGVTDSIARQFHQRNPKVLLIYETAYLQSWWNALEPGWKLAFSEQTGFTGTPDKDALHAITALRSLSLAGYPVAGSLAPLKELPELEYLNLSGLKMTSAPEIAGLQGLKEICLDGSTIRELSMLESLPELETVRLERTPIQHLGPLENCPRLRQVFADSSALSDSAVAAFEKRQPDVLLVLHTQRYLQWWQALDATWQDVFAEAAGFNGTPGPRELAAIRYLEELQLNGRELYDLNPLIPLRKLRELRCAQNQLSSLMPLAQLSQLEVVDVSDNPLQSLTGLESHNRLKTLLANNTAIRDLDPVARSLMLEQLSISGTEVRSLQPLVLHRRLTFLDCSNTRVRNLSPLEPIQTLRKIVLYNTDLSSGKVSSFRASHPECEVVYY